MGKSPCCKKMELKKGPWTPEEDKKLLAYIGEHGHGSWRALPMKAGLQRCGKSCRLRWINYLRPDIKRGKFSLQEDQTIIQLHALLGNRWSTIAAHLHNRTDNEIKNYWNTQMKKRLTKMGIDPVTHKPKINAHGSTANLSHMAQWESARLEAEARLVRESNQVSNDHSNPTQHQLGSNFTNKATTQTTRPQCLDVLKAWQVVISDIFTVGCDNLESLASRLNFSDDVYPISVIELNRNPASELDFATTSVECTGGENNWNIWNRSVPDLKQSLGNPMALHEIMHAENSACFADPSVTGNIVNNFPGIIDYNFDDGWREST